MNKRANLSKRRAALIWLLVFLFGSLVSAVAKTVDTDAPIIIPRQADGSWLREYDSDNITVYSRAVKGSAIREVMAESVIEVPPRTVLAVLLDYSAYPLFMPYVVKNEIEKIQGNKTWLFQQLDFPWPISDRYYTVVLSNRIDPQHTDSYEISWNLSDEESAKQGNGVRIMLNQGGWRLISTDNGQSTRILYYLYTDPGGALPDWVSNTANTIAVPKVIRALKDRAQMTPDPPLAASP